jgi:hypothetical protein
MFAWFTRDDIEKVMPSSINFNQNYLFENGDKSFIPMHRRGVVERTGLAKSSVN